MKKRILPILLTLIFALGCRNLAPDGVYQSDTALYDSELATTTSYELLHTFVSWEKENSAALSKWPEIHAAAENVRKNAKQWFSTANALHDAYKADPSQENKDKLKTALDVIRAALTEATGYMVQTATETQKKVSYNYGRDRIGERSLGIAGETCSYSGGQDQNRGSVSYRTARRARQIPEFSPEIRRCFFGTRVANRSRTRFSCA